MSLLKRIFKSDKNATSPTKPPKGWYVSDAGQDPLHMLWYVVLVSFDDIVNKVSPPRHYISDEKDSFEIALRECINKTNK